MAFACPVPVRYPLKVDDHDKKFSVDIRDKLDKKCQDRLRRLKESSRLVNVTAVLREEQTVGCRCNMHGKRYPSVGIARKMKRSTRSTPNIDKTTMPHERLSYDQRQQQLKKQYYQEMLNEEENELKDRLQYESKGLEKAKKQQKQTEMDNIKQNNAERKSIDEIKLKLEEVTKTRISLEAIDDALKQKLSEMEQIQLNLEMHNKQKQNILETACSNIDKQLEEKTFMIEYPRDSAEVNSKSFCIREDPSIINDSESSCPPYLSDTSLSSTASCAAVDTSSGGLQRTNTFIDIFKQRQSRSKSMPIIQFNGQPQTDSEYPANSLNQQDPNATADMHRKCYVKRDTNSVIKRRVRIKVNPDFMLNEAGDVTDSHKTVSEEKDVYHDEEEFLRSTTAKLVSAVLLQAKECVGKSVRKIPRDSLTIKNACKRCKPERRH